MSLLSCVANGHEVGRSNTPFEVWRSQTITFVPLLSQMFARRVSFEHPFEGLPSGRVLLPGSYRLIVFFGDNEAAAPARFKLSCQRRSLLTVIHLVQIFRLQGSSVSLQESMSCSVECSLFLRNDKDGPEAYGH